MSTKKDLPNSANGGPANPVGISPPAVAPGNWWNRIKTFTRKKENTGDQELEVFRNLLLPPGTYEEGFTWQTFCGALFVAMLMVPGAMYMSLIAGSSIGPAAQWVTLILFIEVARRANRVIKRAELFTLFYITGAIMASPAAFYGGFDGGAALLYNQFLAQSTALQANGITDLLPKWFVPTDTKVLAARTIFRWEWLPAILLVVFTTVMGRLNNTILGYGLFRVASDIEKLPFPMAPLGAQGVMALSEEQDEEKRAASDHDLGEEKPATGSWRWRVFSIGSVIGLAFGFIYLALPTITAALVDEPITLLPIPFVDFTQKTGNFLPAVAIGVTLDIGAMIIGMVLPFYAVIGSFIGLLLCCIANPFLRDAGILSSWSPGDNLQRTFFKNNVDFYFSFSIGIALAIACVGLVSVVRGIRKLRAIKAAQARAAAAGPSAPKTPSGRGDIKNRFIVLVYLITTSLYIFVSMSLVGWQHTTLLLILLFYGFLYTPIISYVTARLEGIAGEVLNIPMVREASFILSGYHGVDVWFLPVPLHNYGAVTVSYRQAELTGTSFWSIWKAELILVPIILVSSLFFANFIWGLAPVPSAQYPYAQLWWEVTAENQAIIYSSTLGGFTLFEQALKIRYIFTGWAVGLAGFLSLGALGTPIFFVYGVIRGLNQALPFALIPQFVGALIGRYYFQKRLGLMWRQYVPVVAAGFSCGMGLMGTLSIGITFLLKAVFQLPF